MIELTVEQCRAILAGNRVGRLVTVVDREAEIFPINYVLDQHSLVFRTAEGSKLFALTVNHRVTFEVDGWDSSGGWSVIARGTATELRSDDDIAYAETLGLRPWVPTRKTHWVRIDIDQITGRQFRFGDEEPTNWI